MMVKRSSTATVARTASRAVRAPTKAGGEQETTSSAMGVAAISFEAKGKMTFCGCRTVRLERWWMEGSGSIRVVTMMGH